MTLAAQVNDKKPEVKILVVDDRADNLLSIETILEHTHYTIVKAGSGRAALKALLKQQDFTLILMDVQMPDLNGFETASLIYERDRLKHIPIIFITAHDYSDENIFKGYQLGGVDYIYKPINPDLLRAKVAVFVELYYKKHLMLMQEQSLIQANKNLEIEINERKISEEKVNQLNNQLVENINELKKTNEELERFAYVASHDLQEPLRKIILFGGIVHENYGAQIGAEGRDMMHRVIKSSERMQLLIDNLLSFSRSSFTAGSLETTDLNVLLKSVLTDLDVFIQQKNAVIQMESLPTVYVNPPLIRQVFQNLLINALKFSREGIRPEISISFKKTAPALQADAHTSYYQLYFKDNGIGFDMQYLDQIFMAFKRLHTQDQYEGTGIGLSICKKIIEKHNGSITAVSELAKGTTFIVSLPEHPKAPAGS